VVEVSSGVDYIDLLNNHTFNPSTGPTTHSLTCERETDDHTQYVLCPASSTNGAIPIWNETSGRQISDSLLVTTPFVPVPPDTTPPGVDIDGIHDLHIHGELTVAGLIDPIGMEFEPYGKNVGHKPENTIWVDSANGKMKLGSEYMIVGGLDKVEKNMISRWDNEGRIKSSLAKITDSGAIECAGITLVDGLIQSGNLTIKMDSSGFIFMNGENEVWSLRTTSKERAATVKCSLTNNIHNIKWSIVDKQVFLELPKIELLGGAQEIIEQLPEEIRPLESVICDATGLSVTKKLVPVYAVVQNDGKIVFNSVDNLLYIMKKVITYFLS
jgi:hypothetical protein